MISFHKQTSSSLHLKDLGVIRPPRVLKSPKITTVEESAVVVHACWCSTGPPRLWSCAGVPGKEEQKRALVLLWHGNRLHSDWKAQKQEARKSRAWPKWELEAMGRAFCKADTNAGALRQASQPVWEQRWAPKTNLSLEGGWFAGRQLREAALRCRVG